MRSLSQCTRTLLSALVAITALGSVITTAEAASFLTRRDCFVRGSAGDMGRKMGERNAARLVTAAWARLGQTCDKVDVLATVLSETPLARPTRGGEFAACFYLGYTDALWDQLDRVYERCGTRCFNAGAEIGRISAEGYCAASLALDGLFDPGFIRQPPLPFFGQNLVLGCKTEYIQVAQNEYPGCHKYTVRHFLETFENSVRQDCFVPTDIPIFDGGRRMNLDELL